MDPFLARTMVETLSKGINPLTGCALPINDSCSNSEIQDALIEVLDHCMIESNEQYLVRLRENKRAAQAKKKAENARLYPRGKEEWTEEEESKLLYLHKKGCNIYQIAHTLKRTPSAIGTRLKKLQARPIYRDSTANM